MASKVKTWKEEYPLSYKQKESELKPQHVINLVSELTNGEAIVTTEVGQHQMWVAHFYKARKPRTFLTSGGLGTMGFGFPAAIGAQLAKKKNLSFVLQVTLLSNEHSRTTNNC